MITRQRSNCRSTIHARDAILQLSLLFRSLSARAPKIALEDMHNHNRGVQQGFQGPLQRSRVLYYYRWYRSGMDACTAAEVVATRYVHLVEHICKIEVGFGGTCRMHSETTLLGLCLCLIIPSRTSNVLKPSRVLEIR